MLFQSRALAILGTCLFSSCIEPVSLLGGAKVDPGLTDSSEPPVERAAPEQSTKRTVAVDCKRPSFPTHNRRRDHFVYTWSSCLTIPETEAEACDLLIGALTDYNIIRGPSDSPCRVNLRLPGYTFVPCNQGVRGRSILISFLDNGETTAEVPDSCLKSSPAPEQ